MNSKIQGTQVTRALPAAALATEEHPIMEQPVIPREVAVRLFNSALANNVEPVAASNSSEAADAAAADNEDPVDDNGHALRPLVPAWPLARSASVQSVQSADEFGHSCRICRWNRSDMDIIICPCKCKGSVGYIHMKCLKRWIMHRRDNRCEICHAMFDISEDPVSFKQKLRAFCGGRCFGLILKHLLYGGSLVPLTHVILQQVLYCMNNLNQGNAEVLTVQEVFVASCTLLTSSALFFHIFEYMTTRCLVIRNIVRHWWMFGSTSNYSIVDVEDDTFDFF